MNVVLLGWLLLVFLGISLIVTRLYGRFIDRSLKSADALKLKSGTVETSIDVVIPAFNEAANIGDCVTAALESIDGLSEPSLVWVADDQSTDETLAIAQSLAQKDGRVRVVPVPPRPSDQRWCGKNWACHVVSQQTEADYLLFIDADVLLGPDCLSAALQEAQGSQADLLTVCPTVVCRFWAEWLIQPIIFGLIVSFCNFAEMNSPEYPEAVFGFGPFMLFRREAYLQIDGHRGVAGNPVEDVALAKHIKTSSMRLRVMLSGDHCRVRMYDNFSALFEGWTKNFHFGFGRSVRNSSAIALLMFWVWSVPQLSVLVAIAYLGLGGLRQSTVLLMQGGLMFMLSLLLQGLIFQTRGTIAIAFPHALKYGALTFVGGILVGAIAIASMIKTETGWGWTWRGRSLAEAHAVSTQHFTD